MSIADLRLEYSQATLSEHEVDADPIRQFAHWFDAALAAEITEPNAMNLATIGKLGRPSARIVLLKDFDARGFTWYTNYSSRKGQDLLEHPYAAITFHWGELERQIRIEGTVERVTDEENDSYFSIRPIKSRLGAIASAQSMPIESRELLEKQFEEASEKYGETPPRPAHWGGYRLKPDLLEFWQGRRSRLHDRVLYTLNPDGIWQRSRLQP